MSWWTNWGFTSSQAQQAAARLFLDTGNVGTPIGGTVCRGSNECASGYACSGGRCVPVNGPGGAAGSSGIGDGTLSGCGGEGGGPCDSLTATNHMARNRTTGQTVYGDVIRYGPNGSLTSYVWEPVYASDGCTIAGCKLGPCGTENGSDCPGNRYCRYDQNGNVSCGCGDPPAGECNVFCAAYAANFGVAPGCEGKTCDECTACDGNYFSSTYNTCVPASNANPCHCTPDNLPPCTKCNNDGTTSPDPSSCLYCVESTKNCGSGCEVTQECCFTEDQVSRILSSGGWLHEECLNYIGCDGCPPAKNYVDPCEGECESISAPCNGTDSYGNATPDCQNFTPTAEQPLPSHPEAPDGYRNVVTGFISSPGTTSRILFNRCDMRNVPEECSICDCNCHNDCPDCSYCAADGKCYPDPACNDDYRSTWRFDDFIYTYEGCSYSEESGQGGCVNTFTANQAGYDFTTGCGPLPHKVVITGTDPQTPVGPCVNGGDGTYFVIVDRDGNRISNEYSRGAIGGTFCGGAPQPAPGPYQIDITAC